MIYNVKILLVRLRNCYANVCDREPNLYVFNLGSQTCLRCPDLQKELDKLRMEKKNMEKDIKLLKEANDKQKEEDEKRRKTNKQASEEIRKVMAEKRELEKDKENLESSKNNITEEYNKVKAEKDQLAEKARNDSTEIERLNNRVNSLLFLEETLEEQIEKSRTFVSSEYPL